MNLMETNDYSKDWNEFEHQITIQLNFLFQEFFSQNINRIITKKFSGEKYIRKIAHWSVT